MNPFFIIGSPRSGTTILRDVLRLHPRLDAPEETFFYRWESPFKTKEYTNIYFNNPVIKKHREIDGIAEDVFSEIYSKSNTRKELQINYAQEFLCHKDDKDSVWFDKTPQNIYGLLSLTRDFPNAKFVHIYRHPYNVIASITMGRSVGKQPLIGAINTWKESVNLAIQAQLFIPTNVINFKYEDFTGDPLKSTNRLLDQLGHKCTDYNIPDNYVLSAPQRHLDALSEADCEMIREMCKKEMRILGY